MKLQTSCSCCCFWFNSSNCKVALGVFTKFQTSVPVAAFAAIVVVVFCDCFSYFCLYCKHCCVCFRCPCCCCLSWYCCCRGLCWLFMLSRLLTLSVISAQRLWQYLCLCQSYTVQGSNTFFFSLPPPFTLVCRRNTFIGSLFLLLSLLVLLLLLSGSYAILAHFPSL